MLTEPHRSKLLSRRLQSNGVKLTLELRHGNCNDNPFPNFWVCIAFKKQRFHKRFTGFRGARSPLTLVADAYKLCLGNGLRSEVDFVFPFRNLYPFDPVD